MYYILSSIPSSFYPYNKLITTTNVARILHIVPTITLTKKSKKIFCNYQDTFFEEFIFDKNLTMSEFFLYNPQIAAVQNIIFNKVNGGILEN